MKCCVAEQPSEAPSLMDDNIAKLLAEAISKLCANRRKSPWGELPNLLPVYTTLVGPEDVVEKWKIEETDELQLFAAVVKWLDMERRPVAVLSARLGSGKTVASSLLHEDLKSKWNGEIGNVLWIPCNGQRMYKGEPLHGVLQLLHLGSKIAPDRILSADASVRLVVLDGIDEAFAYFGRDQVRNWFQELLKQWEFMPEPRPKLLICGRDTNLDSQLDDLQRELSSFVSLYDGRPPLRLDMRPWESDLLYKKLEENLLAVLKQQAADCDDSSIQAATTAVLQRVRKDILESPVLFAIAFYYLKGYGIARLNGSELPDPITDEWDLTKRAITKLLAHNRLKYKLKPSIEDLQQAAENISLHLAVSGLGMKGLTLAELKRTEGLEVPKPWLTNEVKVVKNGLLLTLSQNHYAPFHEWILIHQAAAAARQQWSITTNLPSTVRPVEPFISEALIIQPFHGNERQDLISNLAEYFGTWEGVESFASMLWFNLEVPALQEGSAFMEMIFYWLKYHPPIHWQTAILERDVPLPKKSSSQKAANVYAVVSLMAHISRRLHPYDRSEFTQNYLIEPLIIECSTSSRKWIETVPSDITAGSAASEALQVLIQRNDENDDESNIINFSMEIIRTDQTREPIGDHESLESRRVRSGETLFITLGSGGADKHPTLLKMLSLPESGNGPFTTYSLVPSGPALTWRNDGGFRVPTLAEVNDEESVYMASRLVSVREYAFYLEDFMANNPSRNVVLPAQPDAGWVQHERKILFDQEMADRAVTGISLEEAENYVEWLNDRVQSVDSWRFEIPSATNFQIAARGTHLGDIRSDGSGPFGHEQLIGSYMQWTDTKSLLEQPLVFGHSRLKNYGEVSVQKDMARNFPDLCAPFPRGTRFDQIGIRPQLRGR